MDKLDRTIHRMLKRRDAGRVIRAYGVAAFTRDVRHLASFYGREAPDAIWEKKVPDALLSYNTRLAMAEAFATAFY